MERFYVRNPIALGEWRHVVRVVGEKAGAVYTVGRGRVVEVVHGAAAPAIEKWVRCRCLEPFDEKKHKDAVLEPVPEPPRVTPAWFAAEEARRVEMEDEMRDAERRR